MRLLCLCLILCGCQNEVSTPSSSHETEAPSDVGVALPTLTPEAAEVEMLALLSGSLLLDGRCLYATGHEEATTERSLVVWPPHVSLVRGASTYQLRDARSGASVEVPADGSTVPIVLSGGNVRDRRPSPLSLSSPIPAECTGPYWIAGSLLDSLPPMQPRPPEPPPPPSHAR